MVFLQESALDLDSVASNLQVAKDLVAARLEAQGPEMAKLEARLKELNENGFSFTQELGDFFNRVSPACSVKIIIKFSPCFRFINHSTELFRISWRPDSPQLSFCKPLRFWILPRHQRMQTSLWAMAQGNWRYVLFSIVVWMLKFLISDPHPTVWRCPP